MAQGGKFFEKYNYKEEINWCKTFLEDFEDDSYEPHHEFGRKKYLIELQKCYNNEQDLMEIHLEDLHDFFHADEYQNFLSNVQKNTKRYYTV